MSIGLGALSGAIDLFSPLKSPTKQSAQASVSAPASFDASDSASQATAPRQIPKTASHSQSPGNKVLSSDVQNVLLKAQQSAQEAADSLTRKSDKHVSSYSSALHAIEPKPHSKTSISA
jgi:hypothetical protein